MNNSTRAGAVASASATRTALIRFAPLLAVAVFLTAWHVVSLSYPAFILPGPIAVAARLIERISDGTLLVHMLTTVSEAVPGLLAGTLVAFALGYPIAKSRFAERLFSPFVVASQGVPFVAVAPLIFIWFGSGFVAKVLVCTLIVFFPIIINVIAGLRGIPPHLRDVFRMLGANRRDTFIKLELPAALPFVFAGLRTGGALSMIGALTGEFISANKGLGFLINQAGGLYDTALVMAAIIATVGTALLIYGGIRLIERAALRHVRES